MTAEPQFATGINYSGLNQEFITDPLSLGYSGLLAIGNDDGVANLLNTVGSGSNYTIWRNDIQPREIVNAIQPADFVNMSLIQALKLQTLFVGAPIDASLSGVRTNFSNVFSGATVTTAALSAVAQEQGSRAEVLFGDGTVISSTDVVNAQRTSN